MTISEYIHTHKIHLEQAGIQCVDPVLHLVQIVGHALDLDRTQIYLKWNDPLTATLEKRLDEVLTQRLEGQPFQYLAGKEGFWNSIFRVGPGVLIPRRETELLVETLLERETKDLVKIAELGAGSGNIGISVCLERPSWEWHAFEVSRRASSYLVCNRKLIPQSKPYRVHSADFFRAATDFAPYDWVVSNPPYLSEEEFSRVPLEVKCEPPIALRAGEDGLEVISKLIVKSSQILRNGGNLLCEIGWEQSSKVVELFKASRFDGVEVLEDHAHLPRAVLGTLRTNEGAYGRVGY